MRLFGTARDIQLAICARYGVAPLEVAASQRIGIARNVRSGLLPVNGLRLQPTVGTSGWYIWAGETMSQDPRFFDSLNVSHLTDRCERAVSFLLLPPGWRFLVADDYIDVWFDAELDVKPA